MIVAGEDRTQMGKLVNYKTAESVAEGHPDKIADQISDSIVDATLTVDPYSRVAAEALVAHNRVVLAGEVTCKKDIPYEKIARRVIKKIGYTKKEWDFWHNGPVEVYIHRQAPDIAQGVDTGGAGDQGIMSGYATRETKSYMPLPITLAHKLVEGMDRARKGKKLAYLRPDGKSQVTLKYENGKATKVARLVLAVPHNPEVTREEVLKDLTRVVVKPLLEEYKLKVEAEDVILNGTGKWEVGGPSSDSGMTGRKIVVDAYGPEVPVGGGCFSGKDPTKVDRSAAYACRFLAKNIVAQGLAEKCLVSVAYVIGKKEPLMKNIDCFGTEKKPAKTIQDFADGLLSLEVPEILEKLNLRRPIYTDTAYYGHFGREGKPWEKLVE